MILPRVFKDRRRSFLAVSAILVVAVSLVAVHSGILGISDDSEDVRIIRAYYYEHGRLVKIVTTTYSSDDPPQTIKVVWPPDRYWTYGLKYRSSINWVSMRP